MARSLELSAYRALSRRSADKRFAPHHTRPFGELVWMHTPEADSMPAARALALRLLAARPGVSVLITQGETLPPPDPTPNASIFQDVVPADHPESTAAFIAHWSPDAVLWLWGDLRPNLILAAADAGLHMILANADTDGFDGRRDRWLREVPRALLGHFRKTIARSDAAMTRLVHLGCGPDQIERSDPLHTSGAALTYIRSDFDELAATLRGRPVWCAAAVQPGEVRVVLDAHRYATRLSHRLLLVLNPAGPAQEADCIKALADQGLRYANWDDSAFPDDNVQVLLATSPDELGLWYRTAPVSFLGSSLVVGKGGLNPMHAAALGSAVLYGPNIRNHLHAYSRLASAGAARIVNDANALGVAVARLIAPDQAASMALAGWEVVSESAVVTDRIVDLLQDALDAPLRGD